MVKARRFEELWIWQEARMFVKAVYLDFGKGECGSDFGFRNQIQKAAVSVMNNIAEGFERNSDADFARFLDIAKGSCGEVRSMYYSAEDLGYTDSITGDQRRQMATKISAGIKSLTDHLRGRIKVPKCTEERSRKHLGQTKGDSHSLTFRLLDI